MMKHLKPGVFGSGHAASFMDVSRASMKSLRLSLFKECLESSNLLGLRGKVQELFTQYPDLDIYFNRCLFDLFNNSEKVIMLLGILFC